VEHIPYLEEVLEPICQLSVVAFTPKHTGDYPYCALDFLSSEQDMVIADEQVLIDKRAPGLIERSSQLILAGLGIPIAKPLLQKSVIRMIGFVVTDYELCYHLVRSGASVEKLFNACEAVCIKGEAR
jgi:hypothetical protein